MRIPKVPRFLKNSYTIVVIATLVIGVVSIAVLSYNPHPVSTLKPTSQSQSSNGSSTSTIGSPYTSSTSGGTTTTAPSGDPALSAQEQQADNEAQDQSLMDQNSNTNSTASPSTTSPVNTSTLPDCTPYGTKIGTLDQQKSAVEAQLANVDQTAEDEAAYSGATASEIQNNINSLTEQYDSELSSIQDQINSLNAEYPDCQ